jgi:hypothetical protein
VWRLIRSSLTMGQWLPLSDQIVDGCVPSACPFRQPSGSRPGAAGRSRIGWRV